MAVPSGKIGSDCKTDYSVCGYDYDLKTYLNGTYLANNNSKDAYFSISDDANLTFSSILSVNSLYLVYRYHCVKHCSKWSCWYTCDYYKTENRADSVTVSDSLNATYLNFTSYEKTLVENSGNMLDAWLETQTNGSFRSFELSSGNSYLQKRKYWYRLGYTLDPYDVLVWESMPAYEDTTVKNGIIEKNIEDRNSSYEKTHFLLNSDKQSCDLEITSHFTSQFFPNFCNITTNKPIINLTANNGTVSVFFYENSTKKPLANKNISLFYGGNSTNLITDSNGKATKTITDYEKGGPIKASFETDMETKSASAVIIVPAKQPEIIDKTLELLTSAGALAVIYKAMKVSL